MRLNVSAHCLLIPLNYNFQVHIGQNNILNYGEMYYKSDFWIWVGVGLGASVILMANVLGVALTCRRRLERQKTKIFREHIPQFPPNTSNIPMGSIPDDLSEDFDMNWVYNDRLLESDIIPMRTFRGDFSGEFSGDDGNSDEDLVGPNFHIRRARVMSMHPPAYEPTHNDQLLDSDIIPMRRFRNNFSDIISMGTVRDDFSEKFDTKVGDEPKFHIPRARVISMHPPGYDPTRLKN